jgi:hypothetical protein
LGLPVKKRIEKALKAWTSGEHGNQDFARRDEGADAPRLSTEQTDGETSSSALAQGSIVNNDSWETSRNCYSWDLLLA